MFGIENLGVLLAFATSILSTVLCIVYGILNWNKGQENESLEVQEELKWQEDEIKIEDTI